MKKHAVLLLLALLTAGVVAAGCGGGDGEAEREETAAETEAGQGAGTTLQLAADPGGALEFDKATLEAPAGEIKFELANESSLPHNVAIEEVDAESDTVTQANTSLTVELEPGTYTFFCSVPATARAAWRES